MELIFWGIALIAIITSIFTKPLTWIDDIVGTTAISAAIIAIVVIPVLAWLFETPTIIHDVGTYDKVRTQYKWSMSISKTEYIKLEKEETR